MKMLKNCKCWHVVKINGKAVPIPSKWEYAARKGYAMPKLPLKGALVYNCSFDFASGWAWGYNSK